MNIAERAAVSGVAVAIATTGCNAQGVFEWAMYDPGTRCAIPLALAVGGVIISLATGQLRHAKELEKRDNMGYQMGIKHLDNELNEANCQRLRDRLAFHPNDVGAMAELIDRGGADIGDLARRALRDGDRVAAEAMRKVGLDPYNILNSETRETQGYQAEKARRMKGRKR